MSVKLDILGKLGKQGAAVDADGKRLAVSKNSMTGFGKNTTRRLP